jgi:hypothetical protein
MRRDRKNKLMNKKLVLDSESLWNDPCKYRTIHELQPGRVIEPGIYESNGNTRARSYLIEFFRRRNTDDSAQSHLY